MENIKFEKHVMGMYKIILDGEYVGIVEKTEKGLWVARTFDNETKVPKHLQFHARTRKDAVVQYVYEFKKAMEKVAEEVVVEEVVEVQEEVQVEETVVVKPKYQVVVKRKENDEIVKALGTQKSHRMAMKTEVGMNINLNHKEFYTEIVNVACGHCDDGELNPDEVMNALSRKDNDTYICRACEQKELQAELDALI